MDSSSFLRYFFLNTSYYFVLALASFWCWSVFKAYRISGFNILHFWKEHKKAIILTFLAVVLIAGTVPRYHRILSDETVHLSVAQSMFLDRNVSYVTQGEYQHGKFLPLNSVIETRPFLYPFFIHLLHLLTGYRTDNAYILNYIALWGLLLSVYLILRAYVSELLALAGCLLIITQPVICLSTASTSFEIFNCLFIVLSFLSLRWFMMSRLPVSFGLLLFNLLMLANIRYESIIFFAVILFFLFVYGYVSKKVIISNPSFIVVPLLLFSWGMEKIVGLHAHTGISKAYNWLNKFSFKNLIKNTSAFFNCIFDPSGSLGYAGFLDCLGVIVLVGLILYLLFKKEEKAQVVQRFLFLLCLFVLLIHFLIVLSFAGGVKSHPMNGRYYFPIIVLISVLPVVAIHFLSRTFTRIQACGFILTLALFAYYYPVAMADPLLMKLPNSRKDIFVREFLKQHAQKDTLVICSNPWDYVAEGYGAIRFSIANQRMREILQQLKGHAFSNIYVVEEMFYKNKKKISFGMLNTAYKLETVDIRGIKNGSFTRISRVIP